MLCKKGVLRNFAKFTGKHLCRRLLSNKDAGIGTSGQNLQNISWRLLLSKSSKRNQKLYLLISIHVKRLFQFLKAPIFSCKFFLDAFDFLRFQLKFPKHLIKKFLCIKAQMSTLNKRKRLLCYHVIILKNPEEGQKVNEGIKTEQECWV